MAELVHGKKEHSDWFPERSVFLLCGKLRYITQEPISLIELCFLKDIHKELFGVK